MAEPLLIRHGVTHPVAILRALDGPPDNVLVDDRQPVVADPRLAAAGARHRDGVLRAAPSTWNGPILGFRALEADTVVAGRTDYFAMLATSDALRGELVARGEGGPMRSLAWELAGGDPRRSGAGRASVVGLSILVVLTRGDDAWLVLGRRGAGLAVSPGLVGTIDGCTEPGAAERPILENLARELAEEGPGIVALSGATAAELAASARLQGLTMNMLRLSPTISVEIRVALPRPPDAAGLLAREEFSGATLVEATPEGLARVWAAPEPVAPPAAGALALWEARYFL